MPKRRLNEKKLDYAEQWYQKLVSVNPGNKKAYYTLGVIAWTTAFQQRMDARAKLGMKPDDRGPLTDNNVRAELAAINGPLVEEGIKNLDAAIRLDPEYDDAMAYENLLIREKADLADTKEEYEQQKKIADDWVEKTMATKKMKMEKKQKTAGGIVAEPSK